MRAIMRPILDFLFNMEARRWRALVVTLVLFGAVIALFALVVAAGPFLDGTVTPMLGAIALCGALVLVLSRLIPRQAARA